MQIRTGIGVDVHRLVEGRPMTMGGLNFPEERQGPEGHSDGDVVCHAICDALLSAAGLGDLGTNYGTDDPAWSGASGVSFLIATTELVRKAGFSISNVAVQLIGNTPGLAAGDSRRNPCSAEPSRPRFRSRRQPPTAWVSPDGVRAWRQ